MAEILHRVGVRSAVNDVYRALTTQRGLADWWTTDTRGGFEVGGIIEFRFGTRGYFDMQILELDPDKHVVWQVVRGPEDWVGTKVSFDLKQEGEQATVLFRHAGWKLQSEFMHHCSTKWATFLLSMKKLVETGKGSPFPDDVHITVNWD